MLQRLLTLLLLSLMLLPPAVRADDAIAQAESLLQSVPKSDTPENQKRCERDQQIDIHLSRG
ncbi:hypothetical protein RYR54_003154 [Aeromonas sobria]|nr:hypothetical protein [Aeromonas sobria]